MFTTAGHIWLSGCHILPDVLKWQVLRGGSLINYDKSAAVLSGPEPCAMVPRVYLPYTLFHIDGITNMGKVGVKQMWPELKRFDICAGL